MDFLAKHWGDAASIAGLALTIWFAYRAKTAAEQARDAAQAARDRIFSLDAVKELLFMHLGELELARIAIEKAEA